MTVKPSRSTDSQILPITDIYIETQKSMAQRIRNDCQNEQTQEQISMGLIPFTIVSWTSNDDTAKQADKAIESCHPGLIAAGILTSQTLCHWGFAIPD